MGSVAGLVLRRVCAPMACGTPHHGLPCWRAGLWVRVGGGGGYVGGRGEMGSTEAARSVEFYH